MTDTTYDPEADAAYIRLAEGRVASTEEAGPFLYDIDAEGRILEHFPISLRHSLRL